MDYDDPVNQMNAYYDVRAPWHDEYMSYTSNAAMEKLMAPIIADIEPMVTGKRVLEIACGTGNWTQILAKRARSVLATDVNRSSLTIAKAKDMYGGAVEFCVCDAYHLDQLADRFEVAFAADFFSHVPKQHYGLFLSGLRLRLESGAAVIMIDMDEQAHDREGVHRDSFGNLANVRTLPNGQTFSVIKNFPSQTELEKLLGPYAVAMTYRHYAAFERYPTLRRWMATYRARG